MPAVLQPTSNVHRSAGLPDAEAFATICGRWRPLGAWLAIWDASGSSVALDESGPRFWPTCWRSDAGLRDALAATARESVQAFEAAGCSVRVVHGCTEMPGIATIVVPIRQRARLGGVCLANVLTDPARDKDAWQRFCDRRRLDHAAVRRMLDRIPIRPAGELVALGEMLASDVTQVAAGAERQAEMDDVVRNLDNAYEEINLQYWLSSELSLSAETEPLLRRVGMELLPVCRARGVVFLRPERPRTGPADFSVQGPMLAAVGCDSIPNDALRRLAEQIFDNVNEDTKLMIFNEAAQNPEFAWASAWLRHAVALPMQYRQRALGLMLAINCTDEGDFTSVEVQLLRSVADRVGAFLHKQQLYDDLSELLLGLLDSLINSIDAKDPYTCGHSERVAFLSRRLAEVIGLGPVESQRVYLAGLLHDVGKIGVPDAILLKPGRLTPEEFEVLKQHPAIGARILSRVPRVQDLLPGVLHHHERMDGRGYPQGLAGSNIPRLARILCLVDSLDAMTTTRTYRSFLPPRVAIAEVRRCSGTQFDPVLAEALLALDVPALLAEAHEFAGSVLPGRDADPAAAGPPALRPGSFAARPIFNREMFAAQVTQW